MLLDPSTDRDPSISQAQTAALDAYSCINKVKGL